MSKKIKIILTVAGIIIVALAATFAISNNANDNKITLIPAEPNTSKNLDEFTRNKNIKIYPKIKELLKQNDFQSYTCNSGKDEDRGLVLNIKLFERYDNLYQDTKTFMLEWEKTLIKDTYAALLPNLDLSATGASFTSLDQNSRFAEVSSTNQIKKVFNYSLIPDAIIISTSLDCTKELIDYYFTSDIN